VSAFVHVITVVTPASSASPGARPRGRLGDPAPARRDDSPPERRGAGWGACAAVKQKRMLKKPSGPCQSLTSIALKGLCPSCVYRLIKGEVFSAHSL